MTAMDRLLCEGRANCGGVAVGGAAAEDALAEGGAARARGGSSGRAHNVTSGEAGRQQMVPRPKPLPRTAARRPPRTGRDVHLSSCYTGNGQSGGGEGADIECHRDESAGA